ncbi:MAG: histidine kinase N-terminal 7TM domain-containing protein [Candidatus Promineifilaceae bacterium]
MEWQLTPYAAPLTLTGLITLASTIYTFRQRHVPGVVDLFRLLLAITVWIFAYVGELSATSLEGKLLWAKVQYFGIAYLPIGYSFFALKYIELFAKIKRPRLLKTTHYAIPLLTLMFTWTNEWHGLIWPEVTLVQEQQLSYLVLEHGTWFWVNIGFVYLVLAMSTFVLLRKIFTTPNQFRRQIGLIVVGSLCPWVGNLLYISGLNPFPHLDLTPFAFAITAVCFTLALFRYNFLDIVPIAREIVVEKLEEGVIVLDSQNRVLDVNATAVSLLQQEKNHIIGRPLAFNHPSWAPLAHALQESRPARLEIALDQTYYELSITLLENVDERTNGRLITLHNITRRKESELLLQKAKETAEAADQAKTHFLTNMSHEIRTPLNAVVGMAEMLRQTSLNANQNEMVDVIAESSNTLLLLINNILDFARLEAGNLHLKNQSFSLTDCLEASLEYVQQAANDKRIQLSYTIHPDTPTRLSGDPVRLRQVLVNLLENGIKFSEEGTVHTSVSHVQEKGNILLQFVVRDSGIGIAATEINQLFLPFQQIDGSLTRSYGGNGLGLVICKRLVELMDGNIFLHSEVGQGTSVHFSVLLRPASEEDPPAVMLRQNNASLTGRRLLIIADDASQRRQVSKEARLAGLEVYVASSSQEASYWIDHSLPFDAALLETAVWQADPAILAQLQNPETHTPLPTILLGASEADLAEITAAEPNLFAGSLTQPITGSHLYDLLLNVLAVTNRASKTREPGETMAQQFPLAIMLVEDNQLNQRILKNMLNKLGYAADTAINGRIAVEMAQKQPYDIILMDIQMPEMDGIEATRHILANAQGKRPYIIAVTAHALAGDRESYLAVGMNQYLSKPVTTHQLVEALYQGIEFQKQPTAPAMPPPEATSAPAKPGLLPDPAAAEQPIDLAELARLVGEDTDEFLVMMAPIFLEDTHKLLHALNTAVQNQDHKAIRQAAHTLKGTSASLGMPRLAQFSRELESMAKTEETAEAPHKLAQIEAEYERVQVALEPFNTTAV